MARRNSKENRRGSAAQTQTAQATASRFDPRSAVIAVALFFIAMALFWPATPHDFVQWDDNENITENILYQPLATSHLTELWTVPYYAAYIPVTRVVWAYLADVDDPSNGGAPAAAFNPHKYHAANVIVHGLNVVLVFLVVRLLLAAFRRKQPSDTPIVGSAAVGALIFACHPLQVEPVAWVTGMKDVLYAFFSFLALYLYWTYCVARRREPSTTQWGLLVAATISYLLAILSKSSAVMVPVIAVVVEYLIAHVSQPDTQQAQRPPSQESDRPVALHPPPGTWPGRWPAMWLLAAIPVVLKTKQAEDAAGIKIPMVPLWQRPFVAGDTLAFYLGKIVAPFGLGPDYGRRPTWLMEHAWAYAMIAIPIALFVAAWTWRRTAPWALAALTIFVAGILPVSGITPFDFQAYSTVADRYAYFVMLAPALVAAAALSYLPPRIGVTVGVVIAATLAVLTLHQIPVWTNTTTLFTRGLRVNPRSSVAWLSLGRQLEASATGTARSLQRQPTATDLDPAIADYRMAAAYNPQSEQAQNNLGQALAHKWSLTDRSAAQLPLFTEAQACLERAVHLRDNFPDAHANLGNIYYTLAQYPAAIAQFQSALKYDPNNVNDEYMLGMLYRLTGDSTSSQTYLQRAADAGFDPAKQALGQK